jgi:hypothetical protein
MKTKFFLMITALALISFFSCNKDSGLPDQTSLDLADDDAVSDAVYEDVFNTADNASIMLDQMQIGKSLEAKSETAVTDSCPMVTITHPTDAVWPKVITIDYGTGCTGLNDNVRKGKIVIEVTGRRLTVGSKRTVTFVDYYFNDIKVEGTKVLETLGYNNNQNLLVSETLTGGKLTLPDGKTIERTVNHQREWIAGLLTKNIWDDECLITGTATGKNINNVVYTNTITTALHWERVCKFIVAGVIKMEREGKETIELNYGTGDCDAKATVTIGGETKEILLKNKHRTM